MIDINNYVETIFSVHTILKFNFLELKENFNQTALWDCYFVIVSGTGIIVLVQVDVHALSFRHVKATEFSAGHGKAVRPYLFEKFLLGFFSSNMGR